MIHGYVGLIVTSMLWGVTDPLMRKFSSYPSYDNLLVKLLPFLANFKYTLTFLLNQLGTITFLWSLQKNPLSLAVPVTNSLKFLFTLITGQLLGEAKISLREAFGLLLIFIGILLQILDNHVQ